MADLAYITLPDNITYSFKDEGARAMIPSLPLSVANGGTGATTASGAIPNLGAVDLTSDQVIDGYKEFSEGVTVRSYVEFKSNASTDNGSIWISDGGLGPQFTMYIYRTGAQDTYYLPRLANTESGNHSYLILSEKAPVTIAQGGTGATTASNAIYNLGAMPAVLEEFEGVGRITCEYTGGNTGNLQFFFHQYTSDYSLGHEFYSLPENTNDDTAEEQYYNIITTKDGRNYFVDLTSSQTITGLKNFKNNDIQISKSAPGIRFQNSAGTQIGNMYLGTETTNNVDHASRFQFMERSYNSTTGEVLTKYEQYSLPKVTADRTTNEQFSIWTSKQDTWANGNSRRVILSGSTTVVGVGNENSDLIGEIYWSGAKTNSITHGRWYIGHYSYNSTTGARLDKYEGYYLPEVDADRTTNSSYTILTTKNLSDYFVVEKKTTPGATIAANNYTYVETSITKTGYTPIGIVGWSGTGTSKLACFECYIMDDNATARIYLRNNTSASVTLTNIVFRILYRKNS